MESWTAMTSWDSFDFRSSKCHIMESKYDTIAPMVKRECHRHQEYPDILDLPAPSLACGLLGHKRRRDWRIDPSD